MADITLDFLVVFKKPQAWCTHIHPSRAPSESLTLLWHCYAEHHSSPDLFFTDLLSGHCLSSYTAIHSHLLLDHQFPDLQGPSGLVPFFFHSLLSYLLKPHTSFSLLSSEISSLLAHSKSFHTAWSEFLKRSKIRMNSYLQLSVCVWLKSRLNHREMTQVTASPFNKMPGFTHIPRNTRFICKKQYFRSIVQCFFLSCV